MSYENYSNLKIEQEGSILTVTINRPETRNAINPGLHEEFSRIFTDIDADESVDVVILSGSGGAFCAGGDLNWLLEMHGNVAATALGIKRDRKIQNTLLDLEKPIIAKVDGPAIGLGCSLALYCDFVFASERSVFADPHVSIGLVAGDGGAVMWPQLIGYARARRYLLTGESIPAGEAAAIGLITGVLPEAELDEKVAKLAAKLAKGATHSIKYTKAAINAGLKVNANAVIDRAAAFENVTQLLDDHRIALEAFQRREKPQFTGR
jgi:enoyl-CoA hydratase